MRKFTVIIISVLFFLWPVASCLSPASAHSFGQPPFLRINNEYANLYPVPLTSLYNFDLPQDLAPQNYLLNQSINFELDKSRLPAPPDIVAKTKFDWDFTDGTHAQGLINQHKFQKIGSYIMKIYADDGTTPKPQIIESVLVNILPASPAGGPNDNYQLPQAKILMNSKSSKDPLTDILEADFKNNLSLDGSKSASSNSLEYFWDFGDQKSASGVNQIHQYPADLSQVFVVLRIKDQNGFISDTFVEIQNSQNKQNNASSSAVSVSKPNKTNQLPLTLLGLSLFVVMAFIVRRIILRVRRQ